MSGYQKFWNVSRYVFKLQDVARDYYLTPTTDALCKRIVYFCEHGEPLLLICGSEGIGKSALTEYIQTQLPVDQFDIIDASPLEPQDKPGWLWPRFAKYFSKADKSLADPNVVDFIAGCLDEISEEQRHLLLIIDDAQNLQSRASLSDLVKLVSVHGRVKRCFTLLLLTNRTDHSSFDDAGLAAQLTFTGKLDPWSPSQVEDFIRTRCLAVGLPSALFNQEALATIEKTSLGIPARVVAIAEHCLMEAYINNNRYIDNEIALRAAAYVTKLSPDTEPNPQATREEPIRTNTSNVSFKDLLPAKKSAI